VDGRTQLYPGAPCRKPFSDPAAMLWYLPRALDCRVSSDGSVLESRTGGGINYFGLPPGTIASLFVEWNPLAKDLALVQRYLHARGWGTAFAVVGVAVRDRVYSKDGYGVIRSKVGNWQ
jgi:hypothetical protein